MIYTGIDYHKRYSVACTLDVQGQKVHEARIDGNVPAAFAAYFKKLGTPSELVIEACWNWGVLYDLLEDTGGVAKVVLSHPAKNRIIADAQIKNDRIEPRPSPRSCAATSSRASTCPPARCVSARTSSANAAGWPACAR